MLIRKRGALQLTFLLLLFSLFSTAFADSGKKLSGNQPDGPASRIKKSDKRRPSNSHLTEAEVEKFLKSEVCQQDEVLLVPSALNAEQSESFDRLFACSSMCSIRGCTYYVYLSSEKNRLRPGGLIDGICETTSRIDHGYRQIRCVSQSAEQKTETVWRYDGQQYR